MREHEVANQIRALSNKYDTLPIGTLYALMDAAEKRMARVEELKANPDNINPRGWVEVDAETMLSLLGMIDIVFLPIED
jgi:hypothetical protein